LKVLENENSYWVIRSVVFFSDLTPNIRLAAIDRLAQLSTNGFQRLEVTIATLASIFNWPQRVRFDDAQEMADFLLEEALLSPYSEKWEALVLSFQAKHYLSQNKFEESFSLFLRALNACSKRSYGILRGEIARDVFAVAVIIQGLIPGNHERYHRNMVAFNRFYGATPTLEEAAAAMSQYF